MQLWTVRRSIERMMLAAALHQLPTQIPVACSIVPLFYTMKSYCRWRYGCDPVRVRLVYLWLLV
jgi:hypothetical protein